jgi:hypothetical protein
MLFTFSSLVLIRHLWQLKTVFLPAQVPNTCSSMGRNQLKVSAPWRQPRYILQLLFSEKSKKLLKTQQPLKLEKNEHRFEEFFDECLA